MSQSASNQSLHSQSNLSDAIGTGLPPSSLMQSQISNGPNHVSMQQSGQNTMPTTSLSMTVSSHGTGPGYSHTVPASQNVPMQGQGSIGNYVSRTNINMQSNPVSMMHQQAATSHYNSAQGGSQHYQGQSSIAMMSQSNQGNSMMGQRPMGPYRASQQGSSQQYMGQEEYYSEQYSHGQGSSEPMNQQYYPDGHGDYAYQQSSYTEQSYDRSFDDSTQHYYEGGNSQYSQQQAGYQQGAAQQQTYSQQQYPNQQSYPGQQQGYGPAQGASSQYSSYQQGQGQQYGSYRTSQTGPSAQQQRPYGYEQTRYFVDQRRVRVVGGQGGGGGQSFHSEPRKVFGGPDGGNGGDGGHVIFKGTLVKEDGRVVADLTQHGEEYVAAYGGAGGKGNRFFLSNENRAPKLFTPGEPGQDRVLQLELKTTAHAGLVGFPNAGKSSLLRAISRAKPAVAAYPFTTLNPHVGIVHYQDYEQVAVADIPGLIRGAHQNRGLGTAFLKHIERCRFLLYVLDLSVPQPWIQLQDLKYELEAYEKGLSERPCVVIGNKVDLAQSRINLPLLREQVAERVIALSALTGDNLEELLLHLRQLYDTYVKTEQSRGQSPVKW
ncbi:Calcium-responsive transactivator [Turdus rufiventris]|nr:Calcium-responsive transactivator [Turdus rufiventris]